MSSGVSILNEIYPTQRKYYERCNNIVENNNQNIISVLDLIKLNNDINHIYKINKMTDELFEKWTKLLYEIPVLTNFYFYFFGLLINISNYDTANVNLKSLLCLSSLNNDNKLSLANILLHSTHMQLYNYFIMFVKVTI
jgi:hypothetical protein